MVRWIYPETSFLNNCSSESWCGKPKPCPGTHFVRQLPNIWREAGSTGISLTAPRGGLETPPGCSKANLPVSLYIYIFGAGIPSMVVCCCYK